MWVLNSAQSDSEPLTFRLGPGAIKTVGRAQRADFVVDVALVSRLHCRLTAADDIVEVVDLKSTNGTYVNEQRVERAELRSGDRLRVGRLELTVTKQDLNQVI
jgi:ABC transport system ATP-binding/permease protein